MVSKNCTFHYLDNRNKPNITEFKKKKYLVKNQPTKVIVSIKLCIVQKSSTKFFEK